MTKQLIIFFGYGNYPEIARVKNIGKEYISLISITDVLSRAHCSYQLIKASNFKHFLFPYQTDKEAMKVVKLWEKLIKLDNVRRDKIENLDNKFKEQLEQLVRDFQ